MTQLSRNPSLFVSKILLYTAIIFYNHSAFSVDLDADNDGMIDTGQFQTNLLTNSDFASNFEHWTSSAGKVDVVSFNDRFGFPDNTMVRDFSDGRAGTFYQEVVLADVGFTDAEALDSVLSGEGMQASFGGWLATVGETVDKVGITLTFKSEDGTVLGFKAVQPFGTGSLESQGWQKIAETAKVPTGTRSISYSVQWTANFRDYGANILFDDATLTLSVAVDSDDDGVLDNVDVDNNNDGIVDEAFYAKTLLRNADFSQELAHWSTTGNVTQVIEHANREGFTDNAMVRDFSDGRAGTFYQEVVLADVGFTDAEALDSVLSGEGMQASFGGWLATVGETVDKVGITLTFKSEDGTVLGFKAVQPFGTGSLESQGWQKIAETAKVPTGTRSISYSVQWTANFRDYGANILFDDATLTLSVAVDSDDDGVLDNVDVDNNNDGIVDEAFYAKTLLRNADFSQELAHWSTTGNVTQVIEHASREGFTDNAMVRDFSDGRAGTFYQEVVLADVGFTDAEALDSVLSGEGMQASFGGWLATVGETVDKVGITLTFKSEDGTVLGFKAVQPFGTGSLESQGWQKIAETAKVPTGTRSISYSVQWTANFRDYGANILFDDATLTLSVAVDSDDDGVLDNVDVDNNNDGIVDEAFYAKTLLRNADFSQELAHWSTTGNVTQVIEHASREGFTDNAMVRDFSDGRAGTFYQEVVLADVGFTDAEALDSVLSGEGMQASFGGWLATVGETVDKVGITLTFKSEDGTVLGFKAVQPFGTGSLESQGWQKIAETAKVPTGTRSISYSVQWTANFRDYGANILFDDAYFVLQDLSDTDEDGLPNYQELNLGTSIYQRDTDGDGMPDAYEVFYLISGSGLDPLVNDAELDLDKDGLSNINELLSSTNPSIADTDEDGLLDGEDDQPLIAKRPNSKDADGDGRGDILWRNRLDGRNWLWSMSGLSILSSKSINQIEDQAWNTVGRGDFNGDGYSDVLWRNKETGRNWIYLMQGTQIIQSKQLNYVIDLDWHVKAVGDLDNDGKDDIVWRHQSRGDTWIYLMQDFSFKISRQSKTVNDLNWEIVAMGDVNGDNKKDLIWRHKTLGTNYIWMMDGTSIQSAYQLNTVNIDWGIIGSADINGDGTDDILWRNTVDGRNWAYTMENGRIKQSQLINTVANLTWNVEAISDYDGDGKADIFWRRPDNGKTYLYLLDGFSIRKSGYLNSVDRAWDVID